jgi:hypothetical protein
MHQQLYNIYNNLSFTFLVLVLVSTNIKEVQGASANPALALFFGIRTYFIPHIPHG